MEQGGRRQYTDDLGVRVVLAGILCAVVLAAWRVVSRSQRAVEGPIPRLYPCVGVAAAAQAVGGGASLEAGRGPGEEGAPVQILAVPCTCTGNPADVACGRAPAWLGVGVVTPSPCEGAR